MEKIHLEVQQRNHHSFYVDSNGLLKGEWGGCEELDEKGPNGEQMFEIYSMIFLQRVIINEFGFFYNIFSCTKYDTVLRVYNSNLFICEKNNRFGLVDENDKIILHLVFKAITPHNLYNIMQQIFIVSTETGQFLFNYSNGKESNVYESIEKRKSKYKLYAIFSHTCGYGLLRMDGSVLLEPKYSLDIDNYGEVWLTYRFHDTYYKIEVDKELLYGKVPIDKYDICFEVYGESLFTHFYISQIENKYGLLNWSGDCVAEPVYDDVILYKHKKVFDNHRTWFVICRYGHTFTLYEMPHKQSIIEGCEYMEYKEFDDLRIHIEFEREGEKGFVTCEGVILSYNKYNTIEKTFIDSYIVSKEGKYGVLNVKGEEFIPCIYDSIEWLHSYGDFIEDEKTFETIRKMLYIYIVSKDKKYGAIDGGGNEIAPCIYDSIICNKYGELIATRNGEERNLTPKADRFVDREDRDYDYDYYRPTYGNYSGSYAQAVAGWSDDDIDTVLDGEPDAYWNID